MKKVVVSLILSISVLLFSSCNIYDMHLEKVKIIKPFLVGVDVNRSIFASCYDGKPITWDMLDSIPADYPDKIEGWWFNYINDYSRTQLKMYMQRNNLYIVPKDYYLSECSDFDELITTLEFGSLDNLESAEQEDKGDNSSS